MTFTQAALDAQADFDTAPVGVVYGRALIGHYGQLLTAHGRESFAQLVTALAARAAFGDCLSSVYALRTLARHNPAAPWADAAYA